VSGSATLTVNPPALVSIAVTAATVQLGTVAQIRATGTYTDQSTQDLTATAAWRATNGYVANVSTSGVVTTVGAGETTVSAAQQGLQASAPVTVLASPRYLYVSADAGRTLTRMAVDGTTGQPRFAGYSESLVTGNIGFPCLTVDPSGTHAYLATQIPNGSGSGYSGNVGIYSIDPSTGALNTILGGPFAVSFPLGCLKFDPSGKFAYATSGIENTGDQLGLFSVNADATLTLNSTLSFPYYPTGVAIDPLGQYLYVDVVDVLGGATGSSQFYGYSIDATTGALAGLTGSPWSIPAGTYGELAFHPSGNFLYASDQNATNILEYSLNRSSGAPTLAATVDSTCINPSALQFLPNGNNAYALCGESSSRSVTNAPVVQFSVGATGQLTAQSTAFAGAVATQMQVDEAGKFLYVLGSGSDFYATGNNSDTIAANVVLAFRVQSDGSLKMVQQIAGHVLENSMALLSGPAPVQWKTTSAYITTSGDNRVTPYTVGTDGTLVAGTSLTTGSSPFSASMLPWGSDLLFATQTTAPNLYGYATSGAAISNGSSFGSAAAPGGIVIGPSGDWAFATDPASGLVDQFSRGSAGNWATTFASAGVPFTFSAAAGAGPITMDPSGRYIVVANQTGKSISLIEPLGAAPTPAISLSFTPLTITADGTGNLIFSAGDDGNLHMFSSNGLGTLTDVADGTLSSVATASVAVDPLSRFVYAAGPAGLTAFAIDATAATLTPIALIPGVSLQNATGVYADPSDQYLYVAVSNGSTNALYLFTINADGTLTAAATNPVAAPKNVTSMTFQATVQ
jgi:6-phosphogluconolactonase (cycloisomerase 2 family)